MIRIQQHITRTNTRRSRFELTVLASVALLVTGGLWFHRTRTAAASLEVDPRSHGDNRAEVKSILTRDEFRAAGVGPTLDDIDAIRDPALIQRLLPVGSQYDVVVKGGVVATRTGELWLGQSRPHLAYAFDMSYRRIIEFNDGHRIIERRSFATVRMAKILSSSNGMTLADAPPERLIFDGIQFPPAANGITVGPAKLVAKSMLQRGTDPVEPETSSLCQLQRHPLHGHSIRLTHLDGVGIESVEPLGSGLTLDDMPYLFRQNVLPVFAGLLGDEKALSAETLPVASLVTFCDPTKPASAGFTWQLRPADNDSAPAKTYELGRLQSVDPNTGIQLPTPILSRRGTLRTDDSGTFVADAVFSWHHSELETSRSSLMFDQSMYSLVDDPVFAVQYHCRKLEYVGLDEQ